MLGKLGKSPILDKMDPDYWFERYLGARANDPYYPPPALGDILEVFAEVQKSGTWKIPAENQEQYKKACKQMVLLAKRTLDGLQVAKEAFAEKDVVKIRFDKDLEILAAEYFTDHSPKYEERSFKERAEILKRVFESLLDPKVTVCEKDIDFAPENSSKKLIGQGKRVKQGLIFLLSTPQKLDWLNL